eukprot:6204782-Pleurochrysis_carterae.AAC.3
MSIRAATLSALCLPAAAAASYPSSVMRAYQAQSISLALHTAATHQILVFADYAGSARRKPQRPPWTRTRIEHATAFSSSTDWGIFQLYAFSALTAFCSSSSPRHVLHRRRLVLV